VLDGVPVGDKRVDARLVIMSIDTVSAVRSPIRPERGAPERTSGEESVMLVFTALPSECGLDFAWVGRFARRAAVLPFEHHESFRITNDCEFRSPDAVLVR
jgi:hypothetical protein